LYEKIKKDNADIIFFNANKVYEQKRSFYDFIKPYYDRFKDSSFFAKEAFDILFSTNGLPFKMYRNEIWQKNDIQYSSHCFCEDSLPLISFLIHAKKIAVLNNAIYNYRIHNCGLTSKLDKNYKDIFEVFYLCEKVLLEKENYEKYLVSFLKNRLSQIFYWFFNVAFIKKRKYFNEMKKVFSYIEKKYAKEVIKTGFEAEYKRVLNSEFFEYCYKNKILLSIELFKNIFI
jgi:hypothetical protein